MGFYAKIAILVRNSLSYLKLLDEQNNILRQAIKCASSLQMIKILAYGPEFSFRKFMINQHFQAIIARLRIH